jgi:hypothetical protein
MAESHIIVSLHLVIPFISVVGADRQHFIFNHAPIIAHKKVF